MTADPRIEAAAKALRAHGAPTEAFPEDEYDCCAEVALAAADAVDPLRNPTEDDIDRAAKALLGRFPGCDWDRDVEYRDFLRDDVRAVVAALRGGAE